MVDVVVALVAGITGLAALHQSWRARRRPRGDPSRTLALTMTCVSGSAALFTVQANAHLSAWSGVTNVAEPLARSALIVSVWAGVCFAQSLTAPQTGRGTPWTATCLASAAVVWAVFAAAPATSAVRLIGGGRPDVWVAAYTAAWMVPVATGLVFIVGQTRHHGERRREAVAVGVRLVEAGCWSGLAYVMVKVVTTVVSLSAASWPLAVQSVVGRLLGALAGLLVLAGCLLPRASRAWGRCTHVLWAHRSGLRLYPLWRDCMAAFPELRLLEPRGRTAELLSPWAAEERLYRRVVELRDVQLQLAVPENSDRRAQLGAVVIALDDRRPGSAATRGASRLSDVRRGDEVRWWLVAADRYRAEAGSSRANVRRRNRLEEVR